MDEPFERQKGLVRFSFSLCPYFRNQANPDLRLRKTLGGSFGKKVSYRMSYVKPEPARMNDTLVTGFGFGESSLPQNLGAGQREKVTPPSWGSIGSDRSVGKMIVTLGGDLGRS
jgi:hypothetical protein